MPQYDLRCQICSAVETVILGSYKDDNPDHCNQPMERMVSAPALMFKGKFSGGTRPMYLSTDRSMAENEQEAVVQSVNRENRIDAQLDKHVDTSLREYDFD